MNCPYCGERVIVLTTSYPARQVQFRHVGYCLTFQEILEFVDRHWSETPAQRKTLCLFGCSINQPINQIFVTRHMYLTEQVYSSARERPAWAEYTQLNMRVLSLRLKVSGVQQFQLLMYSLG